MTRPAKTDNANLRGKLELRRHMLRRHHADGDIRVFDCCQGSGVIWGKLRSEFPVKTYWGVDVKPKPGRLKVDSKRVVCQPGLKCNVIDIDTYGMPWEHWSGLLPNIVEPTTVFLTIGLVMLGGGSPLSRECRSVLGIPEKWDLARAFTADLVGLSMARFLSLPPADGFRVAEAWEASPGPRARYLAVRIDRQQAQSPAEPTKKSKRSSRSS